MHCLLGPAAAVVGVTGVSWRRNISIIWTFVRISLASFVRVKARSRPLPFGPVEEEIIEIEKQRMEAVGLIGGSGPCVSASSALCSSTHRSFRISGNSLSYVPLKKLSLCSSHLAAFHSPSHLFSFSPSRPYHAKPRKPTKTHIFLPHLVASMV